MRSTFPLPVFHLVLAAVRGQQTGLAQDSPGGGQRRQLGEEGAGAEEALFDGPRCRAALRGQPAPQAAERGVDVVVCVRHRAGEVYLRVAPHETDGPAGRRQHRGERGGVQRRIQEDDLVEGGHELRVRRRRDGAGHHRVGRRRPAPRAAARAVSAQRLPPGGRGRRRPPRTCRAGRAPSSGSVRVSSGRRRPTSATSSRARPGSASRETTVGTMGQPYVCSRRPPACSSSTRAAARTSASSACRRGAPGRQRRQREPAAPGSALSASQKAPAGEPQLRSCRRRA